MRLMDLYYLVRWAIPRPVQLALRRRVISCKAKQCAEVWPIDPRAGAAPEGWPGWPGGKQFALVLTHDVDTRPGLLRCDALMDLEDEAGFKSSFNVVPERYPLDAGVLDRIKARGFELGVHGLTHDGKLYRSREIFLARAERINEYIRSWGAAGFRSPAMHHNLDWLLDLDVEYDASTFDVDPFEPQPDGMGTIFPFWVEGRRGRPGYVELPYTIPQDFTAFVLMRQPNIELWTRKLDWVAGRGGMVLINVHPDYMNWRSPEGVQEYPAAFYREWLQYLRDRYAGAYWHALPRDVARFVREWKKPGAAEGARSRT